MPHVAHSVLYASGMLWAFMGANARVGVGCIVALEVIACAFVVTRGTVKHREQDYSLLDFNELPSAHPHAYATTCTTNAILQLADRMQPPPMASRRQLVSALAGRPVDAS